MATLIFQFPGRRYHATPWGHHVNEGLIEWPPAPWRLTRALLSVGYTHLGWTAGLALPWHSRPPATAETLVRKLSAVLPRYTLPPAIGAHSRHYMPVGDFKGDRERTTLVFDTWAQIDGGELAVHWNVALDPAERQLLAELSARMNYLGRADSWVEARLATESEAANLPANCHPVDLSPPPGLGWEQVAVLACEPAEHYATWREQRVQAALVGLPPVPLPNKKKLAAKDRKPSEQRDSERERAQAPYPTDLIACLQTDTEWQRAHGWSQPPGSRRALYWRQANALRATLPLSAPSLATSSSRHAENVPFVLLSLTTASCNNHALPTVARSLPQGELLHQGLVRASQKVAPGLPAPTITGCDERHQPLRGMHGHAHVLSLDLDEDGHIDHLLVWARNGLDARDQAAARRTRGTWTKGGANELRVAWAGAGTAADLRRLPGRFGLALSKTLGSGCTWISATPFVPPRHVKERGANSLEGQIRAELRSRGLDEPASVEVLDPATDQRARMLRHHVRVRGRGRPPPINIGLAIRLTFDEPATGPICLGYASHFGLGRFELEQPA